MCWDAYFIADIVLRFGLAGAVIRRWMRHCASSRRCHLQAVWS
jgi:hypothetical protein